ncbi:hypothetical protein D1006_30455 [Burkholderia stabilis]|uniref:Uncharacterized protein n=1 Tax=Burkholderia stabilis TaxID=95485 RepID=A0A4Q2AHY9_9BURK|nr:hypothetical protein D1006_30455 [Burkholderia stabilis]
MRCGTPAPGSNAVTRYRQADRPATRWPRSGPCGANRTGRLFALATGIAEAPVSGKAHDSLHAYLVKYGPTKHDDRQHYSRHRGRPAEARVDSWRRVGTPIHLTITQVAT